MMKVPEATKQGYCEIPRGGCVDLTQINSKTRRGRKMSEKSNCLTTDMHFYQYIGKIPVKVSECGAVVKANEDGKAACVMTRGGVGWTNQTMNGCAEKILIAKEDIQEVTKTLKHSAAIYSVNGGKITVTKAGKAEDKSEIYKIALPDGDYLIRKLTPIEAERLQTLPDDYTAGISDTQRYKCIGNGWTVDVIAHILKGLKGVSI